MSSSSLPQNLVPLEVPRAQKTNGMNDRDPEGKPVLKSPFTTLTLSDISRLPTQQWLLKGMLQTKTVSMVYGDSNSGKTFLVFDWALRISRGLPWLERDTRQGAVLYIAAEGVDGMKARLEAWLLQNQMTASDFPSFHFIGEVVHLVKDKLRIMDTIETLPAPPVFIVIDTLSMCTLGMNENSDDMAEAIKTAHDLKALYNTHVCIVHHVGKSGDYRGHSSLKGNIDTQILLTGDDTNVMTITCMKQRDGARKFEPITVAREVIDLGYTDDMGNSVTSCVIIAATAQYPVAVNSKKLIQALEAIQIEGSTTATIWARLLKTMYSVPESTFYHTILPTLLKQKLVLRDGEPRKGARYEISEDGIIMLAATAKITATTADSDDNFTAATATPFRGSSNAVNEGSKNALEQTQPVLLTASEEIKPKGVKDAKLYGLPLRPCLICKKEDWYYSKAKGMPQCGNCQPLEKEGEKVE